MMNHPEGPTLSEVYSREKNLFASLYERNMIYFFPLNKSTMGWIPVDTKSEKAIQRESSIRRGSIEGVTFVDGCPKIEQADMPLTLSFKTIADLERFCKMARETELDQQ